MMWRYYGKLANQQDDDTGQRSKRLKTVKQLRTVGRNDASHVGLRTREAFVESEDEQEQRDNPELLQAVTIQ